MTSYCYGNLCRSGSSYAELCISLLLVSSRRAQLNFAKMRRRENLWRSHVKSGRESFTFCVFRSLKLQLAIGDIKRCVTRITNCIVDALSWFQTRRVKPNRLIMSEWCRVQTWLTLRRNKATSFSAVANVEYSLKQNFR